MVGYKFTVFIFPFHELKSNCFSVHKRNISITWNVFLRNKTVFFWLKKISNLTLVKCLLHLYLCTRSWLMFNKH